MSPRRAFATRPRGLGLSRRLYLLAGAVVFAWFTGLLWFGVSLPVTVKDAVRRTDAIVVLTGGSGRVHQGLELLAQGRAQKLFVSGVYRGVDVRELLRVSQQSPQDLICCIALGYQADNTRGNAVETAQWMRDEGLESLRLVTSAYHMPRSLLEFRRLMPRLEIVPHPVFPAGFSREGWWPWPASPALIVTEYSKYLVALARDVLSPGPSPGPSPGQAT